MGLALAFAILAILGLMAFVRLAPADASHWHGRAAAPDWPDRPVVDRVVPVTGGALLLISGDASAALARLDSIAMSTPRTRRLAGSVEEGRITWETRSRLWGLPDYTTAQVTPDGLSVYARLRFGRDDLGVNAARLNGWLAGL